MKRHKLSRWSHGIHLWVQISSTDTCYKQRIIWYWFFIWGKPGKHLTILFIPNSETLYKMHLQFDHMMSIELLWPIVVNKIQWTKPLRAANLLLQYWMATDGFIQCCFLAINSIICHQQFSSPLLNRIEISDAKII